MKFLLLLLLSVTLSSAQIPLRVVTWNLQYFPGRSLVPGKEAADHHILEVREAIARINPDVLVLQEVAGEAPLQEVLAGLPDLQVAIVSRFKNSAGLIDAQQIAICSRFPARFVYSAKWEKSWAGAPRGFAFASLDCGPAGVLNVYGLHLKSNLGHPQENTAKREDAMEQLLRHRAATAAESPETGSHWIVCGDFNTDTVNAAVPSERTFPLLLKSGFHWTFDGLPLEQRITCPAKGQYPAACFDQIFTLGLGKPTALPLPEIPGSDHLPVSVDISLGQK